jgi:hypothetical protein
MIAIKIDGREVGRAVLPRNSHHEKSVDRFFTASIDAEGNQVIHANRFRIKSAVRSRAPHADEQNETHDPFLAHEGNGLGSISVEIYRGTKHPAPNVSNAVIYKEPLWSSRIKTQVKHKEA